MSQELTVFKPFEADLATLEESNAGMEFEDTPDGIADRRVWYKKLRKGNSALNKIRIEAKAEYLRLGREVDAEAKTIQVRLDVMEKPHKTALDAIEAAIQAEIDTKAAEAEAKAAKDEADRIADIEAREKRIEELEAKIKADDDAAKAEADQIEREKQIEADKLAAVEDAKRKAEIDTINAKVLADKAVKDAVEDGRRRAEATAHKLKNDRIAAELKEKNKQVELHAINAKVLAGKQLAEALFKERRIAHDKENARIAKELAEKNKQAELHAKEAERVADVKHREKIEQEIIEVAAMVIDESLNMEPDQIAKEVLASIIAGEIPHIKIVY